MLLETLGRLLGPRTVAYTIFVDRPFSLNFMWCASAPLPTVHGRRGMRTPATCHGMPGTDGRLTLRGKLSLVRGRLLSWDLSFQVERLELPERLGISEDEEIYLYKITRPSSEPQPWPEQQAMEEAMPPS